MYYLIKKIFLIFFILLIFAVPVYSSFEFVIVKYHLGDWYNARQGVRNFLAELQKRTTLRVNTTPIELSMDDERIFRYNFLFINGHVPITMNEREKANFRKFVLSGGFVFANDDFGMDESFRKLIGEVFPDYEFRPVPFNHPIYRIFYTFPEGLPKIHEHDGGPPEGLGIFVDGRLALYYAFNTDIADGWDFPEVHNNPPELIEKAYRMGVNIALYSQTY
jgi:hypothetical protein